MGMQIIERPERNQYQARICDLAPGTVVKVDSSIYIKLDKRSIGQGLALTWGSRCSVLFNPKLGSMRQIEYDRVVTVYTAELTVELSQACQHYKDTVRR